MLRQILLFLSIAFSSCIYAQSYKDSVKVQFLRYTDLLVNKEYSKSTDYLNPEFFKIIPKSQLIAIMEKAYNNPAMDFEIESPSVTLIDDNQVIGSANYVKLQYSNYLKMHFKTSDGSKQDTALTKRALEAQFGQNNVTYDAIKDTYRIFVTKNVIAHSKDKLNWTFVVVEDKQKPILEKFIPKELL